MQSRQRATYHAEQQAIHEKERRAIRDAVLKEASAAFEEIPHPSGKAPHLAVPMILRVTGLP